MKKILLSILFALLISMSACNNVPMSDIENPDNSTETVSLSAEELELIEAIGTDLEVVTDSNYADTVTEMIYHTDSYVGRVFQIEGVYSSNLNGDSVQYVYRILNNNGSETVCGLPLVYMEKEILDNSWIRVFGIVNKGDVNGSDGTVLDVIAVESLSKAGQKTLTWTGSAHNH